ncbi:DNA polymerase III subunit gamma/tau [bacterium]|jgi:DNA polymerase III subunit gamma/tau|nr:DNA polymerase III subunit gamma/tau [bacterium]MBT4251422.1 DNA polymerase III subunit gamma/tau [bacterium]MBT4597396.1 DNA polymerase III subunit gamma/tau [bacterium]MBT6754235.1 DNA polymerase III subunit gamma/tau [bacterium]MBT7037561.1 DNA polymerase III subunit gamma/tau [bacterium]
MLALYQKYRPKKFSEVAGQGHIIKTLTNAIANKRTGHAYLFTGPRGTGKTTLARIFAKTINCTERVEVKKNPIVRTEPCNKCESCKLIMENRALDFIEIDAASHTGVDNIRQLRETVPLPPSALKYKVYIIDEVHMLSIGAFNALLKTLEEPPAHAVFILATTELHKVPDTIISRCQRFDVSLLTQPQIVDYLQEISKKEKVEIETEALETIALEAEGGMRDAQSILGQIIALEDEKITAKEVNDILGTSSKKVVLDFVELLSKNDLPASLALIEKLQQEGINLRNFNKNILAFLRVLLLLKTSDEAGKKSSASLSKEQLKKSRSIAKKFSLADILELMDLFQTSLNLFKDSVVPQLPLELATIKHCSSEELQRSIPKTIPKPVSKPVPQNAPASLHRPQSVVEEKIPEQKPQENFQSPTKTKAVESAVKKTAPPKNETPSQDISPEELAKLPKRTVLLSEVQNSWSAILDGIKPENRSIHAFMTNCIPCGVVGEMVYIKTKYDFYKDKLSEVENRLTVQKTTATILNANIKIAFVTEKEGSEMSFDEPKTDDENHNVLHDAMKVLGGKIIKD